jgi:hypothetical protein
MATWVEIAFGLGLTLLVPSHARDEVLLARPGQADLVEVLLSRPSVLVLQGPSEGHRDRIRDRFARSGAFDPLASWVAALCRERGWPALSSDPVRLERLDPAVDIDRL